MVKHVGQKLRAVGTGAVSVAKESALLYGELARTVAGFSKREVPAKDSRFADPAWRENPVYRRLAQSYLAFCETVDRVAGSNPEWRERERARFLGGIVTSSLAPTNTLLGNPAALKHAAETGGASLLSGLRNMVGDVLKNKGMPSQVDSSKFKVGENLAVTPGAVVFRNEMLEVIQYQPMTEKVAQRPTLLVLPPVGKYYFMDLAPGRSFIEYAVSRGMTVFATSWRNPGPEHGHWGLDDYVQTLLDAVDAVCDVSESDKLNLLGMCAGGILSTLMLSVMAARRDKRVTAASFGVMMLDFGSEAALGGFNAKPVLSMAKRNSASKGILPASSLASVFAWMRPNDLVWNYWSNNYLMGKDPPAFDILAWSVDGTNLPSTLHQQFVDIFEGNSVTKGGLRVLGVPIDLRRIRIDTFSTGALTDHLTPWKACYRATQLVGGRSTFVLSNSGHIASLVNPPGNPKSTYWAGPQPCADPEQWLKSATKHQGTWWDVWADWNLKRSGKQRPASKGPGSARFPAFAAAPGTYVHQKS
ncbi:alpha/beta hydrolase [Ramlibacter sp. WS9]|uniref:PHA/PHB synthase family protein n=1 Tax=Ramlibacter sp. WS9 TaxID=1882741 RepID=UPI001141CD80|nr:alpha/beta fold hydrolase [Ramlibacter sp. WS9]ROZ75081.1 alpha/beta fold hydrolase [Ramlibacter sp. WS9]